MIGALLGLASLVIYTGTLAPDVLAHDSGEWQAAGATLGISHSPGSPAYTIVSWLFSLAPLGSPAARVNFVSAVTGAIGVVALYSFMLVLLGRLLPALVSAATLAVAGLWWSHASVATPYTAVPAIIAVLLTMLLLWRKNGDRRLVWGGALLASFGLSWHPSFVFFLPALIAGVFVLGPWRQLLKPRVIILTLFFFLLGLAFYLYLPIRSATDPVIRYSEIDSVPSFVRFVSHSDSPVREEGHGLIRAPGWEEIKNRLVEVVRQSYFPSYAFLVFGPAIVLLYPAVWPRLRALRRPLIYIAAAMTGHMAIVFAVSGAYGFAQYYMPLLLYFSMWAGFSAFLIMAMGEAYLGGGENKNVPIVIVASIYFTVLIIGVFYKWDFVDHSEDYGMRNYVNAVFSRAEPGAVVFANWNSYTGLLYAQKVEGQRSDVRLIPAWSFEFRRLLSDVRGTNPESQILLSATLPYTPERDLKEVEGPFELSIKGRTYQDLSHGEPIPSSVKLFELVKP